jgi:hypothetical protein
VGAIEGRHAKTKKLSPATKTARRTPIKTRRVLGFFLESVPEFLSELEFIRSPHPFFAAASKNF